MADVKTTATDPLAALIDIPLPQEVSLWPQTWPLRIAIVLIATATALAVWRFVHRFHANRYRREALAELDGIGRAKGGPPEQIATRLSLLLRRTALAAFPRETVAPLTGTAWLAFLDRSYGGQEFSQGAGHLLISAPYRRAAPGNDEVEALAGVVRRWIRRHHV